MGLTAKEVKQLIALLEKMEWPLPPSLFRALVGKVITVPIELAVLNKKNEILLIPRKDVDYEGYHMPGTVIRDSDTVQTAMARLLKNEVRCRVGEPRFLLWKEVRKGRGRGENPHRHEISLLHLSRLEGKYRGKGKFFPFGRLPKDTLSHHLTLIAKVQLWVHERRVFGYW